MRAAGLLAIAGVCLLPSAAGVALWRQRWPRVGPLVVALCAATVALLLMALVIDPLRGTWEDILGMAGGATLTGVLILTGYAPVAYAARRMKRRPRATTVAGVFVATTVWFVVLYGTLALPVLLAVGQCPPPSSRVGTVCEFGP